MPELAFLGSYRNRNRNSHEYFQMTNIKFSDFCQIKRNEQQYYKNFNLFQKFITLAT